MTYKRDFEDRRTNDRKAVTPELETEVLRLYDHGFGTARLMAKFYLSEKKLVEFLKAKGVFRSRDKAKETLKK